jgi:ribosomal protein L37AE/L43A
LQLFQEFEENGYVEHICPDCGIETLPTEIDNEIAYCENCQEHKKYRPVI